MCQFTKRTIRRRKVEFKSLPEVSTLYTEVDNGLCLVHKEQLVGEREPGGCAHETLCLFDEVNALPGLWDDDVSHDREHMVRGRLAHLEQPV